MGSYIQYKDKSGQDDVIFGSNQDDSVKTRLGPFTEEVLDGIIKNKVVLIFAQGDLEITPLATALFIENNNRKDVIIGIPNHKYRYTDEEYYKKYFSLLDGKSAFLYKKVLWCNGKTSNDISDDEEPSMELANLKYSPKWGTSLYKSEINHSITHELNNGTINNRSFIVTFPLNVGIEDIILSSNIKFSGHEYHLRPIDPKFVVLESVNEIFNTIEPVIHVIKSLIDHKMAGIIHFSWPYVRGLNKLLQIKNFLTDEQMDKLVILHLGKKFTNNLKDYVTSSILASNRSKTIEEVKKYYPSFTEFSIEAKNWESYYPEKKDYESNKIIFCVPNNTDQQHQNYDESLLEATSIDNKIEELKQELDEYQLPRQWRYFFAFMPFINSFMPPNKLKYTYKLSDTYKKIQLPEIITMLKQNSSDDNNYFLTSLNGIVEDLSKTRHIYDYLKNISTYKLNTKYSTVVSYIFKSLIHSEDSQFIVCEYNSSRLGFKSYMGDYLTQILNFLHKSVPISIGKFPINDYTEFSPDGEIINSGLDFELVHIDFRNYNNDQTFEINAKLKTKDGILFTTKMKIVLENMTNLVSNINYYDTNNSILLLPGPLPIVRFDGEVPALSEGIDLFIRPFKNIVIFVNQGHNLKNARKQYTIIEDFLFGGESTPLSQKDMMVSYRLNNSHKLKSVVKENYPPDKLNEEVDSGDIETTLEESIREEFREDKKNSDPVEYKALKDIWQSIHTKQEYHYNTNSTSLSGNTIKLRVKFDIDYTEDIIQFSAGTYIRVINNNDNSNELVENLKPGQKIAYLKSETRDSLDNYFIKAYSSYKGFSIEDIYEPFKCLNILYKVLSDLDIRKPFDSLDFTNLYWLDDSQKLKLYNSVKFIINWSSYEQSTNDEFRKYFLNSEIWNLLSKSDDKMLARLKEKYDSVFGISQLYLIAKIFGLDYKRSSFNMLIQAMAQGKSKYFFYKEKNLLNLGLLLCYNNIIDYYDELTDAGKSIGTVLKHVGRSLNRVISKNFQPLSEMDSIIQEKVSICKIMEIC